MADILHQFNVKAPMEKVFDAITTPMGLANWWPERSAGEPMQGNVYTFYFGPAYDWRAEVVHVVSGKEITWKINQAIEDWMDTQVGFQLAAVEGQTKVSFFHKNWRTSNEHFRISNFCWGTLLNGLKQYVESGVVVPFGERN